MGALGYTNNITLLSPIKFALGQKLKETTSFSDEYKIKLNLQTCQLTVIGRKGSLHYSIVFNDAIIVSKENATHLDNYVGKADCQNRIN